MRASVATLRDEVTLQKSRRERRRPTVFRGEGTHERDFITLATTTQPQGQLSGRQITLREKKKLP